MANSASGLFRVTGKKAKPVVQRALDSSYERVKGCLQRAANEFHPTPPEPTRALLHAELRRLRSYPEIWEPAAGDGAMVREIEAAGFNVFASDLIDRGCGFDIKSFYDYEKAPARAIVTNPPFAECNSRDGKARWIWHALRTLRVEYMARLLPWPWPGSAGLAPLWAAFPPARVYLMRFKIDFTGQRAPPMLNAWFCWDSWHRGETALRMLDRKDARQGELL